METAAMKEMLRKQGIQIMALELTIRALIGIHPDRELLAGVMQTLFVSREHAIREKGFELEESPQSAKAFADYFSALSEELLRAATGIR